MTTRSTTSWQRTPAAAQGTAMVEFVFSLPLIITLFGCIFFFGEVMKQRQQIQVANYHSVSRAIKQDKTSPTNSEINEQFFQEKGYSIDRDQWGSTEETFEDFQTLTTQHDSQAGELLEQIYEDHYPRRGQTERIASQFESKNTFYQRLADGPMHNRFTRDGRPWRRAQWQPLHYAIPEEYFTDLDAALDTMGDPPVADTLRTLYKNGW